MITQPLQAPLQTKVHEYQEWRNLLRQTITDYRDWLAKSQYSDAIRELRLYDVLEMLKRDQLVLAFLAEFSRGKTEMINALFFADFNQRLLPSEPGRTTMCPTEIFWDAREEPCIKLLPIATRASDDSLTYLKTTPNAWQKFKLNIDSPAEMQAILRKLIEQKEVSQGEAEALGLYNPQDFGMVNALKRHGLIKIPLWRHAIINYPHPLLKSGLVVIDTPGLNTLGAEPELTLSIIPNAHAVLFLTATDTGITQSDMQIWNEFVKGRTKHKLVLLNKIDMLWDALKPKHDVANEIAKQINLTAHQLGVSSENVFAISAQKALIAKIKKNESLLQQSGIIELETTLGNQMIQAKHEILGRTIANECSVMIKGSRKIIQQHLNSLREQIAELRSLRGQNSDATKHIFAQLVSDRKRYELSIPTFNQADEKIGHIGKKLLRHLSVDYLESALASSRKEMGDSWTTVGLNKGMRNLMKQANELATNINKQSSDIKKLADNIYQVFHSKHGFEVFNPPPLDMSNFINNMRALEKITHDFCTDPINVLTEKHFLIRKFFLGLGTQTRAIFSQAEKDCAHWLQDVLGTLKNQMAEHKASLDQRSKNLMQARASAEALDNQLALVEKEYATILKEGQILDLMLLQLIKAVKPAIQANTTFKNDTNFEKTILLTHSPFLNIAPQPSS
ncbi:MAG: dynamin family protein [Methylotenera sp.]|nr:dynamin family protein [Methylotenera sp.]